MTRPVQSVVRAFKLLEILAASRRCCGVRELARETDFAPPTVLALLKTMHHLGYVHIEAESRKYTIGEGMKRLIRNLNEGRQIIANTAQAMDHLHQKTGETTLAIGIENDVPIILYYRRSTQALSVHHENPAAILNRLATGQAVCSTQSDEQLERILGKLNLTVRERREFDKRVRDVRKRRLAEVVNHNDSGIGAIALPVCGEDGDYPLAIGLSVPVHRYNDDTRKQMIAALLETREHILKALRRDKSVT